ncbi:uncharacterized protein A4U43_C05F16080 [Asparagus officinalis]|uniref:Amino acid transporter transmembrane domain-containing protein n=1 Tax=Asparagus officinalis TaxID=4686 RepID=A0A5P1ES05_ASPOF|nr:amino acid transporter ANT1-like [Asparagus officinalis]ONK68792.1 uncharacterized protein A4U43_C05F16080 [Asparagus officinalis]
MEFEGEEKSNIPLLQGGRNRGRATSAQTLGNIVVSILGTGTLGLPFAFRVTGWAAGSLGLMLAGLVSYYCMLLLVECRRKSEEDTQETDKPAQTQTYGDIGDNAFGATGRFLTEFLILVSHAAASIAFFIFIGQNLSSVFTSFYVTISSSYFIYFLLLLLEVLLSFARSLSLLAPFSAFATLCNVFAMAIVIKEDINKIGDHSFESANAFKGVWSIPFAFGVAVFCFEGFGVTLALERSMAKSSKFPWVLLQAFLGIAIAYIVFGSFGYLAYGEETQEIITLNLPNNWTTIIVKVGLCIAITFTIPMIMHPIHEIIELKLRSCRWSQNLCHNSQTKGWLISQVARLFVIVLLTMLATFAPGFAQLMSFTGSTICALISFVLPASFHLKIMGSSLAPWRRVVDYCILLVGLVSAVYGAFAGLKATLDLFL